MMKVTVSINETKIVVPCGDGDLSIRQLAELAIIRYRKTALVKGSFPDFVEINSLKLARDGGILDWDDKVNDVLDDRDLLIAQNSTDVQVTSNCPPSTLSSPPLPHHNNITPGDIITSDLTKTSCLLPVIPNETSKLPLVSTKYVPLSFASTMTSDHFNSRHNSIPCSDHDIHRHFEFFDNVTQARHESLDDILDKSNPNRKLNYTTMNVDYEKWPLPPFPTISTLKSSTETTVLPNNMTLQLLEADADDLTWDNSPNDCDEEDYPRLRPDYIVKHFKTNEDKSIENSVPSRQVLQWLESQECGSVSSSGGGGVGTSSYEAGSDVKESESVNVAANVLDDRNNNRVHASCSSVSSGNDHNRLREEALSMDNLAQHHLDNSIIVRLNNIKAGENLGIQIIPAYMQTNAADSTYVNRIFDNEQKCIYGIEVHSIMPKGRVAKERQLNKGDKIIQINDVNLMGMLYERGESIFREALQKPECKLRVIPYQYPIFVPTSSLHNKGNPPPPPRRSPNTALSGTKSNSGSSDKGHTVSLQQSSCKSPTSNICQNVKTTISKLNPAPLPPSQPNPVASWTSGLGSMVHTPASSTSSVAAVEKKKIDKIPSNVDTPKTELIELTKIGSGFGFSINGAENLLPNIPSAVYVRSILPDGAAIRDGRLKADDRLLEVDGLLLDGMSQIEVISLLREKPSGSRVKLLVLRNSIKKNSPCSASHDSLMTSLSEIEDGSTLSKNKKNAVKLQFDIPLNDSSCPNGRTTLGISVKVEPNWDKANITPFSSKEDIAASNIVWVKTVIENGAAFRHGKLMVGDQLLDVNGISLSGLSSEDALTKLKNIIKEAQDSEDGIINVVVIRKINMARSSSLNTLNSVTGSGSAMSFKPTFDQNRNLSHKLPNHKNITNIPPFLNSREGKEADIVPKRLMVDLPNSTKVSIKPFKRSAPLPPTPEQFHTDNLSTEKSIKSKPVPPPPPLARRLRNLDFIYDSCPLVPQSTQSTSELPNVAEYSYICYSPKKNIDTDYNVDEFPPKNFTEPQCSSTTNTLCRNKGNSQLILRTRNTRSNCSYTPTKEILHIDDIDWDKMELIPFDNCQLNSEVIKPFHKASISQPVINQDIQSKKIHDTGVHKRKAFKKFSLGQMFKFKHSHYSKPSNSAGSSPVNMRKQNENSNNPNVDNAIPISSSSYSLKSSEQADETEFPYAELDFSHSPTVSVPGILSVPTNIKVSNPTKNTLLPLPEESFKSFQSPSSEESDSYEDFVDMQTTFPGHISAVQRITAAMPKQPTNRFVYEDAEELFQSLQANVSLYNDINLSPTSMMPLATLNLSPFHQLARADSKDVYQIIMSGVSTNQRPRPTTSNNANGFSRELLGGLESESHRIHPTESSTISHVISNNKDLYFNWQLSPK